MSQQLGNRSRVIIYNCLQSASNGAVLADLFEGIFAEIELAAISSDVSSTYGGTVRPHSAVENVVVLSMIPLTAS